MMTVSWRRVLESLDDAIPIKASGISRRCAVFSTGISTNWVETIALPEFERCGYVAAVPGLRPKQWLRTPAGTGAIVEALAALHEAAKDKLRADMASHGEAEFFPENSTSLTYEAQREAMRLGWISVSRPPSPRVSITDAGREALAAL